MSELTTTVHLPPSRRRFLKEITELWGYRGFVVHLWGRELRTRYNRSLLGWVWSLLNPLATLLIFSLVFGTIFNAGDSLEPSPSNINSFAHYLFAGLVVWFLFNLTSAHVMEAFSANIQLRRRAYFPPSAPLVARSLTILVISSVETTVMILAYVWIGVVSPTFIAVIPVMILMSIFALGAGMVLAAANARFRDVSYLWDIFLRLFFYLTPIIYPASVVPERAAGLPLRTILELNPISHYVHAVRRATYFEAWPTMGNMVGLALMSGASLLIGFAVFSRYATELSEGS